jgi:hypothetical protein
MPLAPSPLMPGHSPLPNPGERPADRHALRLGAIVGLLTLAVALVPGQLFLTRLVFLGPGLLAHADSNQGGHASVSAFQGFTYWWTRRSQGKNGGFNAPASLQNMQSEARDFHMNTVVIPIVADMPSRNGSTLYWHPNDNYGSLDILPDADYLKAVDDARRAGLQPIFELVVKQQDQETSPAEDSTLVGEAWYGQTSTTSLSTGLGTVVSVATLEQTWVDNYTAFAVHYAQMAQTARMPYFILGDGLANLTSDGQNSTAKADPKGIVSVKGDTFDATKCSGRHECEWRHIIHAVHGLTYATYIGQKSQIGANYQGKLIYGASWGPGDGNPGGPGEFEAIQWWDAVDAIGVDAYFPLTQVDSDAALARLQDAWHGKGAALGGQHDVYSRIQKVSDTYQKLVVFTGAGYESTQGSNNKPGKTPIGPGSTSDQNEQLSDMQSLLTTFAGAPWWVGVIWFADQPLYPRSAQSNWKLGTQWAGNNLSGTKDGDNKTSGQWLASYYHTVPVPCLC